MPAKGEQKLGPEFDKQYRSRVAILDAGAQYIMDIELQLKRLGFYAERLPFETPLEELRSYGAVILSGGPDSVYEPGAPQCDQRIFEPGQERPPVLGICYGAQLINHMRGGIVGSAPDREDSFTDIIVEPNSTFFDGLEPNQVVMMSHGDSILELAPGFEATARSSRFIAAIANPAENLYGVQFHPERSTVEGPAMLRNFTQKIAGLEANYEYSYDEIIEDAKAEVIAMVGERQVLALISGGVDSAGLGKLLVNSLRPEQLFLVHTDNGLMRSGESEKVVEDLAAAGIPVRLVDASEMFLNGRTIIDGVLTPPLHEAIEPEIKRKIIGDVFVKVPDTVANDLGLDRDNYVLAMGTLHTDLVESGSKHASIKAATIKSHHNDTEEVRHLREAGRVMEPWRYLQKDDMREIARRLGLPPNITERQPFPGPGLAIRVICAEGPVCKGEPNFIVDRLAEFSSDKIKTALLAIQTVGVQGDHRTYGNLAALSGETDWQSLLELARTIPKVIRDINRVVYVFGEPVEGFVSSITPTKLSPDVIEEIRYVDHQVNQILVKYALDRKVSQVPVISFPVNFGRPGHHSIGIRTIMTDNFKTGDIALPGVDFPEEALMEIVDRVQRIPGISRVAYDLTSKPPATTEWE